MSSFAPPALRALLASLAALAVCPCVRAQDGGAAAPSRSAPRLQARIAAAAVGDDLITRDDLYAALQREIREGSLPTQEMAQRRGDEILQEMITQRLKVQAGRDLGFDPALMRNLVQRYVDNEIEQRGGTLATAEFLARYQVRPDELFRLRSDEVYARQWELAVTGGGPASIGRPAVDRYLRPGELHAYYQSLLVSSTPAERALAGEEPEKVVLQELILPIDGRSEDDARDLAEQLLAAHEGGADFTQLVQLHGVERDGGDGIRRAQPVEALRRFSLTRHDSAALYDFAREAAVGEVSEALYGTSSEGDLGAIFIYRLVERIPRQGPAAFTDPDLQDGLRKRLQERIDDYRETTALNGVARSAYIWPRDRWSAAAPVPVVEGLDD